MDIFLKTAAGVILALVLILTVGKQEKDIAVLLSVVACCMIAMVTLTCFRPVLDLMYRLESMGNLQAHGLGTLLKIVGIGFVAEVACMVCQDAGNASLGKELQILASAVIINLSLPFFETLLELIQRVLGAL